MPHTLTLLNIRNLEYISTWSPKSSHPPPKKKKKERERERGREVGRKEGKKTDLMSFKREPSEKLLSDITWFLLESECQIAAKLVPKNLTLHNWHFIPNWAFKTTEHFQSLISTLCTYFFPWIFNMLRYSEANEVNNINVCDQTTNQLVFKLENECLNYIFLCTPDSQKLSACEHLSSVIRFYDSY